MVKKKTREDGNITETVLDILKNSFDIDKDEIVELVEARCNNQLFHTCLKDADSVEFSSKV